MRSVTAQRILNKIPASIEIICIPIKPRSRVSSLIVLNFKDEAIVFINISNLFSKEDVVEFQFGAGTWSRYNYLKIYL